MTSFKVSENDLLKQIAEDIAKIDTLEFRIIEIMDSVRTINSDVTQIVEDVDEITVNIVKAKTDLASAITLKSGVSYTNGNTFTELVQGVLNIKTNVDGSMTGKESATYYPSIVDQMIQGNQYLSGAQIIKAVGGDASASHVLAGRTFSSSLGIDLEGQIPSKPAAIYSPSVQSRTITAGQYLSGSQTIAPIGGTAMVHHVLAGRTFSSSHGIDLTGTIPLKNTEHYNPSTVAQIIDAAQYLEGPQTINPVTGTAETSHVLSGKTFSSSYGIDLTGTMENLSDWIPRIWCGYEHSKLQVHPEDPAQAVVTITNVYGPVGYYDRSGVVTANLAYVIPENIRAGVRVGRSPEYGDADDTNSIVGTFTSDATAIPSWLLSGATAYVNGQKITGEMVNQASYTPCHSIIGSTGDATLYCRIYHGAYLNSTVAGYPEITIPKADILPSITNDATADASKIAAGYTAYVNGQKLTGTMVMSLDPRVFDIPGYIGGRIYVPGWVFYNGVYYVIVTVHDPTTSLYIYRYNPSDFTFVYLNRIYTAPYYPLNYETQGCCAVYGNKIIFLGYGWAQTTDAKYVYDMDANTFVQYVLPRQVFSQGHSNYSNLNAGRMLGYRGNIAYFWTAQYIIPMALDDSPYTLFTELTNISTSSSTPPIPGAMPILYDNESIVYYLTESTYSDSEGWYRVTTNLYRTTGANTAWTPVTSMVTTDMYGHFARISSYMNDRIHLIGSQSLILYTRGGVLSGTSYNALSINGVGTMISAGGVSMLIYPNANNQITVHPYTL